MTILIAFDGSADARTAIEYAARHLKPEPAVVLTVWEPLLTQIAWAPLAGVGAMPAVVDERGEQWAEEEQAQKIAEEGVRIAREAGLAEATARAERCSGAVWPAIVEAADDVDASLIVTGSRGLSGAKSVLLGSVSDRVLHHARRPMLIVPPTDDE
ncbi:universal stress protein [Actinomadura hibisca]|uniref:universal stress protein n=1 Tax=Actinomadura hibisca TaxID=68565 RepID=UPI00082F016F|nr:universal stress protein [Actinomadura hibisca]